MSDTVLTVEDAATRLPELVERVAARRDSTVVLKSGELLARLVPCSPESPLADDLVTFLRRWRNEHPDPDDWSADMKLTPSSWQYS
jgi:antitoxin (DNA-binding transcriptional repressor) of toxin-antitoxin stability system